MIAIYYKPTCPFCRRVLAVVDRLNTEVELKNIEEDAVKAELISLGGKSQVPYLVDTDKDVAIYESEDIIVHLQTHYGKASVVTKPRIHISDSVCASCEG